MAEKRTINIDINSNASEAEKDFKSFNKAVDETTKSAKNLDATFEEVYGELQPLTTRMGEAEDRLYELALAGDTASKEYQELLTKVGEYRKVQIQTDLAVDGAATTMTQKLGSALNGATSGFAATQGAMALFGDENQALEESLLKVQSALAIQQGVQGLTEAYRELSIGSKLAAAGQAAFTFVTGGATTGLKLFRAALISTGVGALVVGIGLLVANFDKVKEVLTDVNKGFKEGGFLTKALMIAFAPLIATVKLVQKGLQAIGVLETEQEKAEKELNAQRIKQANEERARQKQAIVDLQDYREELNKQATAEKRFSTNRLKRLETEKKLAMGNAQEVAKIDEKISAEKLAQLERDRLAFIAGQEAFLAQQLKAVEANAAAEKRVQAGLSKAGKDFYKKNAEVEKAYYKLKEKLRTDNFVVLQEINDQINSVNADATVKDKQELDKRRENYKKDQQDRLNARRKIEDIENSLLTDGIEKELEINRDKFRRLREDAKKNTKLTAKERATLIKLFDKQELAQQKVINKKYVDLEKEKNKKIDEEKAKANQERIDKEDALFLLQLEADNDKQGIEIANLQKAFEAKYALAVGNAELMSDLMELQETEEAKIRDKFRKEKADKEKAASDKSIAEAQAEADAKLAIQNAQIANVEAGISLFKDLAGENKKLQALAIAAESAVSIAKTIISTQAANAAATAQGTALAIASGGASVVAAAGLVTQNNISAGISIAAQIAAAAKGISALGGGASAASGNAPSDTGGGGAVPQFNVVGDSGINQIAQLQQQPVQAFVVSGEVTTSQALDRNRVQNATL